MIKFEGHDVEVFEYNGEVLFNPYHVGDCLGIDKVTVRRHIQQMNDKQVVKLSNSKVHSMNSRNTAASDVHSVNIRKLNNAGENFLTESGVYKLIFKSRKECAERFQEWLTDEVLPSLRKASGLEAWEAFRMMDKEHQKKCMDIIHGFKEPTKVNYIKANTIADKAVSIKYGLPKMIKKGDMTPEMLVDRQKLLDSTVELMATNDKFNLELKVSETIYKNVKFLN